jgi:organic hydroperoxide reductase OsmC/OhrA
MTDFPHHHSKTERQAFFATQLNWLQGSEAIITARDVKDTLYTGLPQQLGGTEDKWSPEHILLAALSSSFMNTCMAYTRKMEVTVTHFDCEAAAQLELDEEHYGRLHIHLWPRLYIRHAAEMEKAQQVLLKAQQHCIVANAIKEPVTWHAQVLHDTRPARYAEPGKKRHYFSPMEAKEIGDRLGIDWNLYRLEEFRRGLEVEMEHGTDISETNITHDDVFTTAKIAWAHLHEIPDYYTRLIAMEEQAEKGIKN